MQQYIYDHYDTDCLENVYIAGDGAPWITAGCHVLEKSKFVLDKFHLGKYINKATSHLLDSQEDAKELIYEAINNRDMGEVKRLLQGCSASAEAEGKKNEIHECIRYITNNWLGIMVRIDDGGAVWGCSAEGQISHVLSARESSRPMGWSKTGVHKMTQLRIETRNGTSLIDLMEYQQKQKKKKMQIEQQDKLVREVKENTACRRKKLSEKKYRGWKEKACTG